MRTGCVSGEASRRALVPSPIFGTGQASQSSQPTSPAWLVRERVKSVTVPVPPIPRSGLLSGLPGLIPAFVALAGWTGWAAAWLSFALLCCSSRCSPHTTLSFSFPPQLSHTTTGCACFLPATTYIRYLFFTTIAISLPARLLASHKYRHKIHQSFDAPIIHQTPPSRLCVGLSSFTRADY